MAKGGTAPLTQVYKYAEPVTERGFVYMDSPGYDPASVTGQIASGSNLIVFTTGRACLMLRGQDPLHRAYEPKLKSYWGERKRNNDPMRYTHQY